MRLLVTRRLPQSVEEALAARFDTTFADTPLTAAAARAAMADYDVMLPTLGDDLSAAAFPEAPRCRLLANFGVGVNHIDLAAARAAGVAVTNTPGAVTDATADIAIMLMLMAARRASEGEALVRAGAWQGWRPTQLLGLHVTGKRLGIVGMGRIGRAVARRAHHGFGMQIAFYNRSPVADAGLPARQVAALGDLLGESDAVVIAVPGGAETRHLIGADALAAMQPHAVLVNIARGDVIDEAALIAALQARRIAAAGLDVYEEEPRVPEALRALPNVTLLPHLGTASLEVREAMGRMAYGNLCAFAEGEDLPDRVA